MSFSLFLTYLTTNGALGHVVFSIACKQYHPAFLSYNIMLAREYRSMKIRVEMRELRYLGAVQFLWLRS
jgi:hypothetical protein